MAVHLTMGLGAELFSVLPRKVLDFIQRQEQTTDLHEQFHSQVSLTHRSMAASAYFTPETGNEIVLCSVIVTTIDTTY